jgi:hypothetical protein
VCTHRANDIGRVPNSTEDQVSLGLAKLAAQLCEQRADREGNIVVKRQRVPTRRFVSGRLGVVLVEKHRQGVGGFTAKVLLPHEIADIDQAGTPPVGPSA